MKLYDFTRAPNPRRVRIFLGEKGITVAWRFAGANRTPEALRRNPYGGLPVLELDDGTCIAESVAICRYFEDLHHQPALMGSTPKTAPSSRCGTAAWSWFCSLISAAICSTPARSSRPASSRCRRWPRWRASEAALAQMRMIDGFIAGRRFIAGERYTIADITAMAALGLGAVVGLTVDSGLANLTHWYGEVSARPSARA